jgi:catechol 2,3-dioxygenase
MSQSQLLPISSAMGAVTLWVADLSKMINYYQNAIGLELINEFTDSATLGFASNPIVILESKPQLRHASPKDAGLFHTAILFPTQAALAKAVARVAQLHPGTFTGSADHLVSQAFYFNDPEGNGIELYWDRDRSLWSWTHGSIEMDTLFLDPNEFLREHLVESEVDATKQVGHVHLSVGSIAAAEEFYVKMLGFEQTMNWNGQALFVSAGGYHHHMAMNIWRSKGAGKRQLTLGLAKVEINLDNYDEVAAVNDRLKFFNQATSIQEGSLKVNDPWGNLISIQAKN